MYPNLFAELIRRGWSDRDLKLLAGENVLRVLARAEEVARSLSREALIGPSTPVVASGWQFWIDRGGTFTDVVARRPDGDFVTLKLLSENPEHYPDAAVEGIRELLGVAPGDAHSGRRIEAVRWVRRSRPTRCSSAKAIARCFVITRGFADALRIAYQHRPKLFVRHIELPSMLYEQVVEVDERMGAHGEVVRPLNLSGRSGPARAFDVAFALRDRASCMAIGFPAHERSLPRSRRASDSRRCLFRTKSAR